MPSWLFPTFVVDIGTMPPPTVLEGIPTGVSAPPTPHHLGEAGSSHKSGSLSATLAALASEPDTEALGSAESRTGSKSTGTPKLPSGVFMGDGLSPVPAKLVAKIQRGEFVDMGELLPEFNVGSREEDGASRTDVRPRRSRSVTDILSWLQCYGTYVSVLAPSQPELIPELMAYMSLIIRVSQDYSGLAWVRYDAAFRRQAALTGNKRWSVVNSSLFAINFTGTAKAIPRCELCFATTHTDKECAQQGNSDPGLKDRLRAIESAVLVLTAKPSAGGKGGTSMREKSGEACRNWNRGNCSYPKCRHNHACSSCGGGHQAVVCTQSALTPDRGFQSHAPSRGGARFQGGEKPY